jgi:hypothetical protein
MVRRVHLLEQFIFRLAVMFGHLWAHLQAHSLSLEGNDTTREAGRVFC